MVVGNDSALEYGVPMRRIEASFPDSKLRVGIRSSMRRIEASFPDSKLRVGIRSSDATHRSFFSGFGVPSWNTEFRCDASKLLFRIRSSEFDFGVPMRRT